MWPWCNTNHAKMHMFVRIVELVPGPGSKPILNAYAKSRLFPWVSLDPYGRLLILYVVLGRPF